MNKKQKSGLRGTHLAAAELIRNEMNAFLTSRNSKGADIIVSDEDGIRQIGVQVKTNTTQSFFTIGEPKKDERYFYVLVDIHEKGGVEKIRYFVFPSTEMEKIVRHDITCPKFEQWNIYLKDPRLEKFENRWNLIRLVLDKKQNNEKKEAEK